MLYSDFTAFTKDQERLISMDNDIGVDYLEGQLMMSNGIVDTSFFPPSDQPKVADLVKKHGIIYLIEVAKYYDDPNLPIIGQVLQIYICNINHRSPGSYRNKFKLSSLHHINISSSSSSSSLIWCYR